MDVSYEAIFTSKKTQINKHRENLRNMGNDDQFANDIRKEVDKNENLVKKLDKHLQHNLIFII